jgi:L-glyceraldehyde 3-phosphate reductase
VGVSNYPADMTRQAAQMLRALGTPCLIHQPYYNMFGRWIEEGLTSVLEEEGVGCIAFSPLAQGLLTSRYLEGIPADSRAVADGRFLQPDSITEDKLTKVRQLNEIAQARGQTMAQLALAWVLRLPQMTSALIGASKVSQIEDAAGTVEHLELSAEESQKIDQILAA